MSKSRLPQAELFETVIAFEKLAESSVKTIISILNHSSLILLFRDIETRFLKCQVIVLNYMQHSIRTAHSHYGHCIGVSFRKLAFIRGNAQTAV